MSAEQMLAAAVTALTAAVIALWRVVHIELKECKRDRRALWRHIGIPIPVEDEGKAR